MGTYASKFNELGNNPVARSKQPTDADWLTAHASATHLRFVEVDRLWNRFQMLGCERNGVLSKKNIEQLPATKDVFVKKILMSLSDDDGNISFQAFLNAMQWAEYAPTDDKIRAVFQLLYDGSAVSRDRLLRILASVYPDDSQERTQEVADMFLQEMDKDNRGSINVEQFMHWARKVPADTMEGILGFSIIPPELSEEENPVEDEGEFNPGKQIPSDRILEQIAGKVYKRDWHLLANRLGLTSDDIKVAKNNYPKDAKKQVWNMLMMWKNNEGAKAYTETLEKALRESHMNDAALLLAL